MSLVTSKRVVYVRSALSPLTAVSVSPLLLTAPPVSLHILSSTLPAPSPVLLASLGRMVSAFLVTLTATVWAAVEVPLIALPVSLATSSLLLPVLAVCSVLMATTKIQIVYAENAMHWLTAAPALVVPPPAPPVSPISSSLTLLAPSPVLLASIKTEVYAKNAALNAFNALETPRPALPVILLTFSQANPVPFPALPASSKKKVSVSPVILLPTVNNAPPME